MPEKYYSLDGLLGLIDEPNRDSCYIILEDNYQLFREARGSTHNHQTWEGGYLDHVTEVMNIGVIFYSALNNLRPLPFSLSDALLVLYLHDLEKPWRYNKTKEGDWKLNPTLVDKKSRKEFVENKIKEYGFELNKEHWNGIKYAEGEHDDYTPKKRVQLPLAAFVHLCDNWSARGWFDYPAEDNDPWVGAKRKII